MIHVHHAYTSVGYGDHRHQAADADPDERTARTWAFSCSPECERRVLKDVQHTASNAEGVPLTVEESTLAEEMAAASRADVARLAMALSTLAAGQGTAT